MAQAPKYPQPIHGAAPTQFDQMMAMLQTTNTNITDLATRFDSFESDIHGWFTSMEARQMAMETRFTAIEEWSWRRWGWWGWWWHPYPSIVLFSCIMFRTCLFYEFWLWFMFSELICFISVDAPCFFLFSYVMFFTYDYCYGFDFTFMTFLFF